MKWVESEHPRDAAGQFAVAEKADLKAIAAKMAPPRSLPENHESYFLVDQADALVPLSALRITRAREKGIENAGKFMQLASEGKAPKRKPVSVFREPDGKITVRDGNSTVERERTADRKTGSGYLPPMKSRSLDDPPAPGGKPTTTEMEVAGGRKEAIKRRREHGRPPWVDPATGITHFYSRIRKYYWAAWRERYKKQLTFAWKEDEHPRDADGKFSEKDEPEKPKPVRFKIRGKGEWEWDGVLPPDPRPGQTVSLMDLARRGLPTYRVKRLSDGSMGTLTDYSDGWAISMDHLAKGSREATGTSNPILRQIAAAQRKAIHEKRGTAEGGEAGRAAAMKLFDQAAVNAVQATEIRSQSMNMFSPRPKSNAVRRI